MTDKSALIVIDIQHDFLPGGSLAVIDGDQIIPGIIDIINSPKYNWDAIVYSQDWHPKDHTSFASNHQNTKSFDIIEFTSTKDFNKKSFEKVWPNHCIQHTWGAGFPKELIEAFRDIKVPKTIIQKGQLQDRDYYSAFNDIWDDDKTELNTFLKEQGITNVFTLGLAYDYCVKFTSESSARLGYKTYVLKSLSKAIEADKLDITDKFYTDAGVKIIESLDDEALDIVKKMNSV